MGRVVHFDISADDPEKVAQFYTEVFGWKVEKMPMPEMTEEQKKSMGEMMGEDIMDMSPEDMAYWSVETGPDSEKGINGGLSKRSSEMGQSKTFLNTIGVEDLEDTIEKIKQAGGEIVTGKMPIPDVGWYARAKDPDGNYIGILQEDKGAKFKV